VPGDLAVVGFDDIPLAALVTPALTTCHVPRYDLGARAMDLLLAQVQGGAEECAVIVLQPELIVRESAPWGTAASVKCDGEKADLESGG
jgi:DNA-binding LacI/PurR family transcriptional regulator